MRVWVWGLVFFGFGFRVQNLGFGVEDSEFFIFYFFDFRFPGFAFLFSGIGIRLRETWGRAPVPGATPLQTRSRGHFCAKVDDFVPRVQRVNLGIVLQGKRGEEHLSLVERACRLLLGRRHLMGNASRECLELK